MNCDQTGKEELLALRNCSVESKQHDSSAVEESDIEIVSDSLKTEKSSKRLCACEATVLLADDNAFNIIALRDMLKLFEIKCDVAENGKEVVEKFCADQNKTCCSLRYRLILTDLDMPVMDGIQAARKVFKLQRKAKSTSAAAPIVAVTAYDDSTTFYQCKNAGIEAIINKPIGMERLNRILRQYYQLN